MPKYISPLKGAPKYRVPMSTHIGPKHRSRDAPKCGAPKHSKMEYGIREIKLSINYCSKAIKQQRNIVLSRDCTNSLMSYFSMLLYHNKHRLVLQTSIDRNIYPTRKFPIKSQKWHPKHSQACRQ